MSISECVRFAAHVNLETGCDRFTIAQFEGAVWLEWRAADGIYNREISVGDSDIPQLRRRLQELGFEVSEVFDTK